MHNMIPEEREIIKNLHLKGRGILVTVHVPQKDGGCHPFDFLRGVFINETHTEAFERVEVDILQYLVDECQRSCECNSGKPVISYRIFPR